MAFNATFEYKLLDNYSAILKSIQASTQAFRMTIKDSRGDVGKFVSSLKHLNKATKAFEKSTRKAQKSVAGLGARMTMASTKLANLRTGFAAAMLGRFLTDTISVSLEFEQALNKIESRGGATAKQMRAVRKEVRLLGLDSRFSAIQIAGGMAVLRQRGLGVAEALLMIRPVITMATAGDMAPEEAAKILTGTMKALQMDVKDAGMVTDVFAISASNSALGMTELNAGLINFAPLGKAAGMEFKEMAAMVAAYSEGGVMGAKAGTLLMNSVRNIIKPSKLAIKVLNKFKIPKKNFIDAKGNIKDLTGLFEEFNKKKLTAKDIFEIFQVRGAKAVAVMKDMVPKVRELVSLYDKQAGAAKRMADIMNKGVIRAAFEASSAWTGMKEAIAKSLEPLTIKMMEWVDAIASFIAESPKLAKFIGVTVVVLTALLYVITAIGVVLAVVGGIIFLLGGAVTLFIGVLLAGIIAAIVYWDELVALTNKYKFYILGVLVVIGAFLGPLALAVGVVATLWAYWDDIWGVLKNIGNWIADKWGKVTAFFGFGEDEEKLIKAELSASGKQPDDVNTITKVVVENVVTGSIDINDKTGGAVSGGGDGGFVPLNVITDNGYNYGK